MGPEDRFARRPLVTPAWFSCPVCGDNHVLRTAGRLIYLECPLVPKGQAVDVQTPWVTAMIRRATAAWN